MTQEEIELVVKDLCGRLPYGVMCKRGERARKVVYVKPYQLYAIGLDNGEYISQEYTLEDVKPYLRPMSSMTEKEYKEWHYLYLPTPHKNEATETERRIDWLNKNHFDYRGLIEKGLALEAPEGMYD